MQKSETIRARIKFNLDVSPKKKRNVTPITAVGGDTIDLTFHFKMTIPLSVREAELDINEFYDRLEKASCDWYLDQMEKSRQRIVEINNEGTDA